MLPPYAPVYGETGQRVLGPSDRLKLLRSQLASLEARYAPDHPDVLAVRREIAGLEKGAGPGADANDLQRRLGEAEGKLAAARERYTPDHPDVRQLESLVANLRQAVASAGSRPAPAANAAVPDNPAYIQLQGQIDSMVAERNALQGRERELRARIEDYDRRISRAPEVERELRGLVRDYDSAKARYQEVRSKQMVAQVSQNLETERKGERFTLIDPPLPPEGPAGLQRWLVIVLGTLMSLGIGIGVAMFRESLDPAVRGAADLRRLVDVAPLAVVPVMVTAGERLRARRTMRLATVGSVASLLVALVLVHFLVKPLDIVWLALERRLGV
jgi:uncharacterized protein involved in exopolysaccharide biosynthesis